MSNPSGSYQSASNTQVINRRLHQQLDLSPQARLQQDDTYQVEVAGETVVVFNHPDHAQTVFQQPHRYPKGFHRMMRIADDSRRRAELRLLRPHFHRQRLAALCDLMIATIDESMKEWTDSGALGINLHQAISQVSLAVLTRAMFGLNCPPPTLPNSGRPCWRWSNRA